MPADGSHLEEREFIAGSRATWERLDAATVEAAAKGVARLGPEALKLMHEDYRRTAADLAFAQTHYEESRTTLYLNRLVARAHAELYGAAPRRLAKTIDFLVSGYPRLVRANARPVLLATALFLAATLVASVLAYVDWSVARTFVPEAMREGIGDQLGAGPTEAETLAAIAPLLTAGITANNIQVALTAFAGGMTAGALTAWAMIQNGLLLGALAGAAATGGQSLLFWSLIVPHGSLELPAIMLAGGAGFVLARAILFPGDLPRTAALRAAGSVAVRLVLGALPLFAVAGIVEGFFTPGTADPLVKLAVGAVLAAGFLAYVMLAGRGEEPTPAGS